MVPPVDSAVSVVIRSFPYWLVVAGRTSFPVDRFIYLLDGSPVFVDLIRQQINRSVLPCLFNETILFKSFQMVSNRRIIETALFGSRLLVEQSWRCESVADKGDVSASPDYVPS